jgi:DNA invertase Pin-like site-specific DNA recombinase
MLEVVRELKALGVDVLFEKENIHSISEDGELMLTILASYAQEESRSVSENCKWRIRHQFQDGELTNLRFMYGYHITKGEIEIDPEEAAIVRMIFDDYLGGIGLRPDFQKATRDGHSDHAWRPMVTEAGRGHPQERKVRWERTSAKEIRQRPHYYMMVCFRNI